jgi:hypothetical protein
MYSTTRICDLTKRVLFREKMKIIREAGIPNLVLSSGKLSLYT